MTLSATQVKALSVPGRYSDGGGLHLFITKAGRKSWVLRITIDGRRRDIGLGGYPSVSLARAREKSAEYRDVIAEGRDPVAEKRAPAMPTFREAAHAVHKTNKPRWRNDPARCRMDPDPGTPRDAGTGQRARGQDRSRRRAAGPHSHLDYPS